MKGKDPRPYKYEVSVVINTVQSYQRGMKRPPGKIVVVSDGSFFIETQLEVLQGRAYAISDSHKPGYKLVEMANGPIHVLAERLRYRQIKDKNETYRANNTSRSR